jgi:parvulin-like peptidyl-prolyl isomerase
MTNQDTQGTTSGQPISAQRRWLPAALTVAAVAICVVAGRWTWGTSAASAQSPRAAQPARAAAAPPAGRAPAANRGTVPASATAPAAKTAAGNAPAANVPNAQSLNVVAVVNNEQITRDHLAHECMRRFGKDVLESIVNKHLIWQECQARGITITEKDVADEVMRMAGKFGLSPERWLTMLREERDISPDQYRREIVWPTIALRQLAAGQIQVTPEELRIAFESEYGPQVKVRLIAVSAKAKAEQIHQQVTAQPDRFADIAKEVSEDPNSAAARGQIPPIRKHIGDPEVERVAFSLKEGQISPVLFVANQYLILKCEKHLPESYVASNQLKQIESQLHDQIRDNKMRNAAAKLFQTLQEQAKVVNVFNDPQLSKQMPGIAATVNKGQVTIQQLAEECIQRHGKDVLEGEINRKLLEQELRRRNKTVTQRDMDVEIARAADAYGFIKPDRSPDVEGWLKAVTETEKVPADLYVRDSVWPSVALKTIVGDVVQITQEDLDKGFESNFGERVEVLAIVLNNQREASRIWDMARGNPTDEFFGELAQQYSVEPVSRSNFGKVPPIRRYGGQPNLEEEAFKLKVGELSGIVAVGDKFIIMRCQGRTKPVVSDRESVAEELRKDIREKKLRIAMAEEFDRLRETAQIDNYLAGTAQAGKRASAPAARQGRAAAINPSAAPSAPPQSSRGVAPANFPSSPGARR